jgi:hypothetical protein
VERFRDVMRQQPARTDAKGAFVFEGLQAGDTYRISAQKKGFSRASAGPFPIKPGTVKEDLELRLDASASVRVRLLDQDGKPVSALEASVYPDSDARGPRGGSTNDVPDDQIAAEGEGRFRLSGLPVARPRWSCSPTASPPSSARTEARAGQDDGPRHADRPRGAHAARPRPGRRRRPRGRRHRARILDGGRALQEPAGAKRRRRPLPDVRPVRGRAAGAHGLGQGGSPARPRTACPPTRRPRSRWSARAPSWAACSSRTRGTRSPPRWRPPRRPRPRPCPACASSSASTRTTTPTPPEASGGRPRPGQVQR